MLILKKHSTNLKLYNNTTNFDNIIYAGNNLGMEFLTETSHVSQIDTIPIPFTLL